MNNSTAKAKPKMTVKNGVVYGDALSAQEKKRIVVQKKKDRKAKKVRKSAHTHLPYHFPFHHNTAEIEQFSENLSIFYFQNPYNHPTILPKKKTHILRLRLRFP